MAKRITAPIAASSSGDNTLVAAAAGKAIRVLNYKLSFGGTVNAKFKSGASTDLTGLLYGAAAVNVGSEPLRWSEGRMAPLLETAAGEALVLNLSGAVAVGGHVTYEVE